MAWATKEVMRRISGYTAEDIDDADVDELIAEADRSILNIATVYVYNEKMAGSINGANVYFRTKHRPIADSDMSGSADSADVTVSLYDANVGTDKFPQATVATVSAVTARTGVVTLDSAPSAGTTDLGVYADYRYLKGSLTADNLKLASNYYLAYLCACSISGRLPVPFTVGGITQREGMAGAVFYHRAIDILNEGGYISPEQTGEVSESEKKP